MIGSESKVKRIDEWQIDYLDGRKSRTIQIPHSWNTDKSVEEEGPVLYKTVIEKPSESCWLVFRGVSYQAKVKLDGEEVATHQGIWDAFSVQIKGKNSHAEIEVEVTKNGGPTFPVPQVVSGFLPYVYQTFGGIFREVELHAQANDPLLEAQPQTRADVVLKGNQIWVDGQPFFMRGILHWGWYPRLGRPSPSRDQISKEVAQIKELGFNCVKFCLWIPPHSYLETLQEQGLKAWIELPLWLPEFEPTQEEAVLTELERIIRQYRYHPNIIIWTGGCELGNHVSALFRKRLFNLIYGLTACPLVRDDSGGAEMYGGEPTEYATFDDYHPYADLHRLPELYQNLIGTLNPIRPILFGEYGDHETHRDLARLQDEHPYWASVLPEYNAKGVRWAYDLPMVLGKSDFAHEHRESGHQAIYESSRAKNAFIRSFGVRASRAVSGLSGYVVTALRDTPIGAIGMFDDWGEPKITAQQASEWNQDMCLFLIPRKSTPFRNGSNLSGNEDPFNLFLGPHEHRVGIHGSASSSHSGIWKITKDKEVLAHDIIPATQIEPLLPQLLVRIPVHYSEPGNYQLEIEFGPARLITPITVVNPEPLEYPLAVWVEPHEAHLFEGADELNIQIHPFDGSIPEGPGLVLLSDIGTQKLPFWRSCAFQYSTRLCDELGIQDNYSRLLPMSHSAAIDPHWLQEFALDTPMTTHLNRIDTNCYAENPILAQIGSHLYVTTLRPQGGEGNDPLFLKLNPSGIQFLRDLSDRLGQA